MKAAGQIEVPPAWENLEVSRMAGIILVIGATDTGKTTLARYLYHRLSGYHERLAFIDGDMGQATLGPPTTMTMALSRVNDGGFPPAGRYLRSFVGAVSPTGHMLSTVVGAHRLVEKAREGGATAIVFDTTGLVAEAHGGGTLKRALVDLLRPEIVVALQRKSELEHLLVPLRRDARIRVIDRCVAGAVRHRDVMARRKHRAEQFRRTFETAELVDVNWLEVAVIPFPAFSHHRLVALEDGDGFALALGIVTGLERGRHSAELLTPLSSLREVEALRLGDLAVDPQTFHDRQL